MRRVCVKEIRKVRVWECETNSEGDYCFKLFEAVFSDLVPNKFLLSNHTGYGETDQFQSGHVGAKILQCCQETLNGVQTIGSGPFQQGFYSFFIKLDGVFIGVDK